MVTARRLHRLHKAGAGQVRHWYHAAERRRRADTDRGVSQRGADLVPERTRDYAFPRPRRKFGTHALYCGRHWPQRTTVEDAELCVRSILVTAIAVSLLSERRLQIRARFGVAHVRQRCC